MTDGLRAIPDSAEDRELLARFDDDIDMILDRARVVDNRDLLADMMRSTLGLGVDGVERLDLKIARAALREMRAAYSVFAPYLDTPKVTIFGSARVTAADPLWNLTRDIAAALANHGWMVVTGAGPGIMEAGMEGAGAERSIGVRIRLPFEIEANGIIARDPKLVSMNYFFTRKLMLVKESAAFVAMPGGFGTLDETIELLTLQQTGKSEPTPIVLLDVPSGNYWNGFARFIRDELVSRSMVNPDDMDRVLITDSVEEARDEILRFWRNYHSLRWVGNLLVLRLNAPPSDDEIAELNDRFGHMLREGSIRRSDPLTPELATGDELDRPRLVMDFDLHNVGSIHKIIRAVNEFPSAAPGGGVGGG